MTLPGSHSPFLWRAHLAMELKQAWDSLYSVFPTGYFLLGEIAFKVCSSFSIKPQKTDPQLRNIAAVTTRTKQGKQVAPQGLLLPLSILAKTIIQSLTQRASLQWRCFQALFFRSILTALNLKAPKMAVGIWSIERNEESKSTFRG